LSFLKAVGHDACTTSLRSSDFSTPTNPKKHLMNSSVCLLQVDCGLLFVAFEEESKGWFGDEGSGIRDER